VCRCTSQGCDADHDRDRKRVELAVDDERMRGGWFEEISPDPGSFVMERVAP
jgi:hypothetical protein